MGEMVSLMTISGLIMIDDQMDSNR